MLAGQTSGTSSPVPAPDASQGKAQTERERLLTRLFPPGNRELHAKNVNFFRGDYPGAIDPEVFCAEVNKALDEVEAARARGENPGFDHFPEDLSTPAAPPAQVEVLQVNGQLDELLAGAIRDYNALKDGIAPLRDILGLAEHTTCEQVVRHVRDLKDDALRLHREKMELLHPGSTPPATPPESGLRECPFDDGESLHGAKVRDNGRDGCGPADTWWVQCKCGAEGPNSRDPDEAVIFWNRRTRPSQPVTTVGSLREHATNLVRSWEDTPHEKFNLDTWATDAKNYLKRLVAAQHAEVTIDRPTLTTLIQLARGHGYDLMCDDALTRLQSTGGKP